MKIKTQLILLCLLALVQTQAQSYVETFDQFDAPSSEYGDGSYVSDVNSLTWTYYQARSHAKAGKNIDMPSAMLNRNGGYIESQVIADGITQLSFDQYRGFSDEVERTFELIVTDETTNTSDTTRFTREATATTVETFSVDLDIKGNFSFKIENTTESMVVVIDNIMWMDAETSTENVDNISDPSSSYHSGTYTDNNAEVWTYKKSRSAVAGGGAPISGVNSIMLNSGWGYLESPVLTDGIAELSFTARQAFSGRTGNRTLKVQIFDEAGNILKGEEFIYAGIDSIGSIESATFKFADLSITGKCKFRISNTSDVVKSEIMIDDIVWKSNYSIPTSIGSDAKQDQLKVYGSQQNLFVEQSSQSVGMLRVYNINGKLIQTSQTQEGVNVLPFSRKGLFIVSLELDNDIQTQKVLF